MDHEKIIRELKKVANWKTRDDFNGLTLKALRRRGLIYRHWNGDRDYLTPRARKLLKQHSRVDEAMTKLETWGGGAPGVRHS